MIPKSHKLFIKPTAEELECSETLVNDVVGFFYSELRKKLNDIEHPRIKINHLGTFKIKTKELLFLKAKIHAHHNALNNPESFTQMKVKKELEDKINNLARVIDILKEESKRKKQIKEKRHEEIHRDLEK